MTTRPVREELVLAAAGLGWVIGWLWPQPWVACAVGAGTAAGLVFSRRRPRLAAGLVLGSAALAAVLGVPGESPATLLPGAVVVYGLGRWAGPYAAVLGVVAFLVPPAWSDGPTLPTVVFGIFLYGLCWGFGQLVAAKAARAVREQAVAVRAQAQDPQQVAAAVVAEERTRLAGDITAVVGACVGEMTTAAELARADLSPARIERIRQCGTTGVTELRRLLGLLRDRPSRTEPADPVDPSGQRLRISVAELITIAVLVGITVLGLVAAQPRPSTAVLVVLTALPLVLAWRRRHLVAALLVAAGALALVGLLQPVPLGAGPPLVLMLLSWSAAVDGRRSAWGSWLAMVAVAIVVDARAEPENVAMLAVLVTLAAWAGHAWTDCDRSERAAHDAAAAARSVVDAAVVDAVRAERLRIARDLHDVTSHAVGVMVMHAGAAAAQRERDPERARTSLGIVVQTGLHAAVDLDRLTGLIDGGALGVTGDGLRPAAGSELADRLRALTDRVRGAGLDLSLRLDPADLSAPVRVGALAEADGSVDTVVYRVVQESVTNALRHAPGSRVDVEVRAEPAHWQVRVADDGGSGRAAVPGAGFGLVGVAERVRDLGGSFTAGPAPERGWSVTATIPYRSSALAAAADASGATP